MRTVRSAGPDGPAPDPGTLDPGAPDPDAVDRALLSAHVRGDRDAFGRLVARHRDRLYRLAVRTLAGDREEAADALQDALLQAARAAATYRGEARVSTWLHRVVVNACLDRLRRAAARPTVPLPVREPASSHDALAARETADEVQRALRALPLEQRTALVLVELCGLPVAEAAEVLGVPVGTVTSRCARGRARLAVALGHLAPARPGNPLTGADVVPGGPPGGTGPLDETGRGTLP